MSARNPLSVVWDRADASEPRFSADEVALWPEGYERQLIDVGVVRRDDNAITVVCDACHEGHIEEVVSIVSRAATAPRAYIHCPEAGRVRVPLERLTQWVVDFAGLADTTARALDLAGELEEVVPGRIWYLGKATMAGRSREVFLARGLMWMDATDTVARCEKLNGTRLPVVFVPGAEPPKGVWRGDRPSVVTLKSVVDLRGDGRVRLDRNHLESILSDGRRETQIKPQKSFPTPAGAKWRDIMMTVMDTHVTVDANRKSRDFSFAEAGFGKGKKGATDSIWVLLKVFGMRGGVIPFDDDVLDLSTRNNLKQYVTQLRKRLRALIPGIEGNPLPHIKKENCYRAAFRIGSRDAIRFPTPVGTPWSRVSITLLGEDAIRVMVPELERFTGSTYSPERRGETLQWETAERESELGREYSFRMLQLADETGQLDERGNALVEVLQRKGVVKRPDYDDSMIELCGFLTEMMGIKASPFDFAPNDEKWVARFDASSEKR